MNYEPMDTGTRHFRGGYTSSNYWENYGQQGYEGPIEYKGFILDREPQHLHWFIISGPDGTECPNDLRGRYTKKIICTGAIDGYLARHKIASGELELKVIERNQKNTPDEDHTNPTPSYF